MQPKLELLAPDLVRRVLDEAFLLLRDHGVKVQSPEAVELLRAAGAKVDEDVVHLAESVVSNALETVPRGFPLHDRSGAARGASRGERAGRGGRRPRRSRRRRSRPPTPG